MPKGEIQLMRFISRGLRWMLIAALIGSGLFPAMRASADASGPLDTWTVRSPVPTSNPFYDVIYANGSFIAAGYGGTIVSSTDGESWKVLDTGIADQLNHLAYGAGTWVAAGAGNKVLTSDDGTGWMSHPIGISDVKSIAYGEDKFVAVGASGMIATSEDGAVWELQDSGVSNMLYGIAYGGDQFVAVGASGTVLTSGDGIAWEKQTVSGTPQLNDIAYGGQGEFVAVGNTSTILTSDDGVSWESQTSDVSAQLQSVDFVNGTFMVLGTGSKLLTSSDGEAWTSRTLNTFKNYGLYSIAYGNGLLVAVGLGGTILSSSDDGATWTQQNQGALDRLQTVGFFRDTFVVVGLNGTMVTSTDDSRWSGRFWPQNQSFYGIASSNDTVLTVGTRGAVMTSSDGTHFDERYMDDATNKHLLNVIYGNGLFVAGGQNGRLFISNDEGVSWEEVDSGTEDFLYGAAYGNGVFVLTGNFNSPPSRTIVTSSDGETWTPQAAEIGLSDVAFGNGKFVAVGSSGSYLTSTDGLMWEQHQMPITKTLRDITYGHDMFMAVGDNGTVATSADGEHWTFHDSGVDEYLFGVAYGRDTFVIVGDQGLILQSAPLQLNLESVGIDAAAGRLTGTSDRMEYNLYSNDGTDGEWKRASDGSTDVVFVPSPGIYVRDADNPSEVRKVGSLSAPAPAPAVTADLGGGLSAVKLSGATTAMEYSLDGGTSWQAITNGLADAAETLNLNFANADLRVRTAATSSSFASLMTAQLNGPPGALNLQTTVSDRAVRLDWLTVTGATYYDLYMTLDAGHYGSEPLATVTESTYTVTGLTNGTPHYFTVKALDAGRVLSESEEVAATPDNLSVPGVPTQVTATAGNGSATITFTAPADDGGSPITGYAVFDSSGNQVAWAEGNVTSITVTGLTNGSVYSFTVKAVNAAGSSESSAMSNAVTPTAPSIPDDEDDDSETPPGPVGTDGGSVTPPKSGNSGVDVLVNGRVETAGIATIDEIGGRQVLTVALDEDKLRKRLEAEGDGATITVPVSTEYDAVIGKLNGRMVKDMEGRQAVVEIRTGKVTFTLPAAQIDIDAIAKRLGTDLLLQDIQVMIEIASPEEEMMRLVDEAAANGDFEVVFPPLDFRVSAVYGGRTEDVTRFDAYIERTVAIPDGIDPNRITTGVVVEPDGTVRHVPTKVIVIDGRYYARINSLTNSTYSVVWHPLAFKDVEDHWAKEAVNNMGSRMVVEGTGQMRFSPDRDITRAEFAAIMARGLGLGVATSGNIFTDVQQTDWFGGAVQTAYAYGLVSGFEDGTFRPNDKLTREQAMQITAKAMEITGLDGRLGDRSAEDGLHAYRDAGDIGSWAVSSVKKNVQTGIVTGRTGHELAPKSYITRAEVAVIVERLLKKSDLI